jgi:hypothetical protein
MIEAQGISQPDSDDHLMWFAGPNDKNNFFRTSALTNEGTLYDAGAIQDDSTEKANWIEAPSNDPSRIVWRTPGLVMGVGSPEGVVRGRYGMLYHRTDVPEIWLKTTTGVPPPTTGWQLKMAAG